MLKSSWIAGLVVTVVLIGAFFGWRWYHKRTPEYALAQIESAIEEQNRLRFQTYVDMDRLVPAIVDQVVGYSFLQSFEDASGEGLETLGAAAGAGLANQLKPALTQALRSAMLEAVETGGLDSLYNMEADTTREIDLALFQQSTDPTASRVRFHA